MKKIALKIMIELDAAAYADNEGVDPAAIRADLASYVQSTLAASHVITEAAGRVTVR